MVPGFSQQQMDDEHCVGNANTRPTCTSAPLLQLASLRLSSNSARDKRCFTSPAELGSVGALTVCITPCCCQSCDSVCEGRVALRARIRACKCPGGPKRHAKTAQTIGRGCNKETGLRRGPHTPFRIVPGAHPRGRVQDSNRVQVDMTHFALRRARRLPAVALGSTLSASHYPGSSSSPLAGRPRLQATAAAGAVVFTPGLLTHGRL